MVGMGRLCSCVRVPRRVLRKVAVLRAVLDVRWAGRHGDGLLRSEGGALFEVCAGAEALVYSASDDESSCWPIFGFLGYSIDLLG